MISESMDLMNRIPGAFFVLFHDAFNSERSIAEVIDSELAFDYFFYVFSVFLVDKHFKRIEISFEECFFGKTENI